MGDASAARKIRILVVDDHPIVRDALAELLSYESDMVVTAKAGDAAETMKAIKKQQFDLAIVDMMLKDTTGIEITKKIKALYPDMVVMIFSMSDKPEYIKGAFEAGAIGYITKDEVSEKITYAIRQVLRGKTYLSKGLIQNISKDGLDGLWAGKA